MYYKYTDKEIKSLLSNLTILIDSREQQNSHITKFFDDKKIKYTVGKLDYADYSCYMPSNLDTLTYGIVRDTHYDISIERKNSLEELSSNFCEGRTRFENEFLRSRGKLILMVESEAGFDKLMAGKYNTKMNKNSYIASLFSFSHRYNIDFNFVNKENAGAFIWLHCYYYVRSMLAGD
jgi:ERCC4-type nuclease